MLLNTYEYDADATERWVAIDHDCTEWTFVLWIVPKSRNHQNSSYSMYRIRKSTSKWWISKSIGSWQESLQIWGFQRWYFFHQFLSKNIASEKSYRGSKYFSSDLRCRSGEVHYSNKFEHSFSWEMSKVAEAANKIVPRYLRASMALLLIVRVDFTCAWCIIELLHAVKLVTTPCSENSGKRLRGRSHKNHWILGIPILVWPNHLRIWEFIWPNLVIRLWSQERFAVASEHRNLAPRVWGEQGWKHSSPAFLCEDELYHLIVCHDSI